MVAKDKHSSSHRRSPRRRRKNELKHWHLITAVAVEGLAVSRNWLVLLSKIPRSTVAEVSHQKSML